VELPEYEVNDSKAYRSDTELHFYVSRMHLLVSQMIYLFWDNVAVPSSRVKKPQILLEISIFPDESTKLSQNAGHKLSSNMAPHTWRTENGAFSCKLSIKHMNMTSSIIWFVPSCTTCTLIKHIISYRQIQVFIRNAN
jgi:hypothetical protein